MSLLDGEHLYLWPNNGWSKLDLPTIAADTRALGYDGIILHSGLNIAREAEHRLQPFADAGLKVSLGLGGPKPTPDNLPWFVTGIVACLRLPGIHAVVVDAESAWEYHKQDAKTLVDAVLAAVPDAAARCVDVPWWAPSTLPSGSATHPGWPVLEFGALVTRRFPQCYGAPVSGATARMTAWARKQYAALGSWPVAPCVQAYKRTVADHVALYTSEPDSMTWNLLEADESWRTARKAVCKLRSLGLSGSDAVKVFQRAHGLTEDNVCGPATLKALGL